MCRDILPLIADTISPSHQCNRELLSLEAYVKYKVIPSIQDQGQGLGLQGQRHMTEICRLKVHLVYYAPPLIGGGNKQCFCLTPVCRIHRA